MLAAKQAGITKVIIPLKNEKDLSEIPDEIKNGIEVVPCEHVEHVMKVALELRDPEKFMQAVGLKVLDANAGNIEVAN